MKTFKLTAAAAIGAGAIFGAATVLSAAPPARAYHDCGVVDAILTVGISCIVEHPDTAGTAPDVFTCVETYTDADGLLRCRRWEKNIDATEPDGPIGSQTGGSLEPQQPAPRPKKQCPIGGEQNADEPCPDPMLWRNCSDGDVVMRYAPCKDEIRCPSGSATIPDTIVPAGNACPPPEAPPCPDGQPRDGWSGQCPGPKPPDPPPQNPPPDQPQSLFHGCSLGGLPPVPTPAGVPCLWGWTDTGPM